jgi:predicted TIM-barrel fold metal-dependent hydrolase
MIVNPSDYPLIAPERWIEEFTPMVPAERLPGILKTNAITVLGLG